MPPNIFSIFLGNAKTIYLKLIKDDCCGNGPVDLTNCTEIVVALPNADGSFTNLKLSSSQVSIASPKVLGAFSAPISAVNSALLNVGEQQNLDVTFTIGVEVFTVRYAQCFTVLEPA